MEFYLGDTCYYYVAEDKGYPMQFTGCLIFEIGTVQWRKDGELHKEDGPALIRSNGYGLWYNHGKQIKAPK